MEFNEKIAEAYSELYSIKYFKKCMVGKTVVHTRYDKFLSQIAGDTIYISRNQVQSIVKRYIGGYSYNSRLSQDQLEIEFIKLILFTESLKYMLDSFNRMAVQLEEYRQAALSSIHLEAAWIARDINTKTKTYDSNVINDMLDHTRISFFPDSDNVELESGKRAEFYYDILSAWYRNVKTSQMPSQNNMKELGLDLQTSFQLLDENIIRTDPYSITILNSELIEMANVGGGEGYSLEDNPLQLNLGSALDELARDLEIEIDIDSAAYIDTQTEHSQSQSFGYDDGATDFSYMNPDKRYSTDEAMFAGSIGAYEQCAFIFDVSGSMGFIDYSKVVLGLEQMISHYGKVDLYPADTSVVGTHFDVTVADLYKILPSMNVGGGTDMLNVGKQVLEIAAKNNRRYTHVFIFTDGGTSYNDLSIFTEANVLLYICDPRVTPPKGVRYKML